MSSSKIQREKKRLWRGLKRNDLNTKYVSCIKFVIKNYEKCANNWNLFSRKIHMQNDYYVKCCEWFRFRGSDNPY